MDLGRGKSGINEHGVILGNESVISRDMSEEGEALLGMDMVRLALERATTAEEAVRVIGELMNDMAKAVMQALMVFSIMIMRI